MKMLTVREAAERLGMDPGAVRRLCEEDEFRPKAEKQTHAPSPYWLIPASAVARWKPRKPGRPKQT